ncbi:MAG TPA: glycosyltransferase family protein, partial [Methanoregula sp.]|nr:glycosyltransferase family protein [Methanoregula sp.]
MKILFVVCGEGLGHASRCLHLGRYLHKQGHDIHFASYGRSLDFLFKQEPLNLHRTRREVCLEGEMGFFSLKKTLWCSKWIVLDMVLSVLRISQLIRKHRFACVVSDTMYGGVL